MLERELKLAQIEWSRRNEQYLAAQQALQQFDRQTNDLAVQWAHSRIAHPATAEQSIQFLQQQSLHRGQRVSQLAQLLEAEQQAQQRIQQTDQRLETILQIEADDRLVFNKELQRKQDRLFQEEILSRWVCQQEE
jgi:hypothetical protein